MIDTNIVCVPGICAGHPEHPELLWVFTVSPSGKLYYKGVEIDFSEPDMAAASQLKIFDVDMSDYDGCPYCEAGLYFFCKCCHHLSCFAWEQVESDQKWICWACHSKYRMKIKKTPFQVAASVSTVPQISNGRQTLVTENTRLNIPTEQSHITNMWHPRRK
jgi:hypothetical protein